MTSLAKLTETIINGTALQERAGDAIAQQQALAVYKAYVKYLKGHGPLGFTYSKIDRKPIINLRGRVLTRFTGRDDLTEPLRKLTLEISTELFKAASGELVSAGENSILMLQPSHYKVPKNPIRKGKINTLLDMTEEEIGVFLLGSVKDSRNIFLHELTHWLDRLRMGSAAWTQALRDHASNIKDKSKGPGKYYNHPIELNAFFQSYAAEVRDRFDETFNDDDPEWVVVGLEDYLDMSIPEKVTEFMQLLTREISSGLSPESKKRFKKRAAGLYQDLKARAVTKMQEIAAEGGENGEYAQDVLQRTGHKVARSRRAYESLSPLGQVIESMTRTAPQGLPLSAIVDWIATPGA